MFKREVWNTLGGFRAWRCGADTDFYERMVACGFAGKVIEKFLYYRRCHPDSLTVHPATNYLSEIRKKNFAKLVQYRQEYLTRARPTGIQPEVAEIERVYE